MLPLAGVRIIELAMWGAGPVGCRHMADLGAEVIKIEGLPGGDRTRGVFVNPGLQSFTPPAPQNFNYVWEWSNRGKKSIGVDLTKKGAAEVVYRILEHCDVFVTSLRKQSLVKLGLGYEELTKHRDDLIYVCLSSWGPEGPDRDLRGQDVTALARSGLMSQFRHSEQDTPQQVFALSDTIASLQLAYAIATGLLIRQRTGTGQEINVSLLGAGIAVAELLLQVFLSTGKTSPLLSRESVKNPIRNIYQAQDGKWLALGLTEEKYWVDFCETIGYPKMASDPRFVTINQRGKNARELISILDEVMLKKRRDEWLAIFKAKDLTCAPVNDYADLASDPQVLANGYVVTVNHPLQGLIKEVGPTIQFCQTPAEIRESAPEFAQHTEEVLTKLGGYTWQALGKLKAQGIIA